MTLGIIIGVIIGILIPAPYDALARNALSKVWNWIRSFVSDQDNDTKSK